MSLPVVEVRIPLSCPNDVYEAAMERALSEPPLDAVTEVAFGDLFLEEIRAHREQRLAPSGRRALFPVWGRDGEFHTFVHAGPIFAAPIAVTTGELVERDGFAYRDILAA